MITVSFILTVIAIILVLWILSRLYGAVAAAVNIPAPWGAVIYWVVVLVVVVWALGYLGIMQPIVK